MTGLITSAVSGFYYVYDGEKTIECRARGIMRKTGSPLVGDTVEFTVSGDSGTVEKIVERKNRFVRPPIANVRRLFIVSSYKSPSPNLLIIDKLICECENNGIEPVIVFNKSDMGDFSEYEKIYTCAGYKVFTVSCVDGSGLEELKGYITDGINVFTGNSGVGKSSIINRLFDWLDLKTGEVSDKLGRGRHTTRTVQLFKTGQGYVADTPGFSTVECEPFDKDNVAYLFREFRDYLGTCRFNSCTHTCEQGCAVIRAVNDGLIPKSRHEDYCTVYNDSAMIKDWQRKKKD